MSTPTQNVNLIRQNYHQDSEAGVNRQINMELYASYVYHSMAMHFDRHDVALPGFYKFFKKSSDEEREHAEKLMHFQNKRGGRVLLKDILKPSKDDWGTGLEAMEAALELEKNVNVSLLTLHKIAAEHDDGHMTDFLEGEYLEEQVKSMKEIADLIAQLKRAGPNLGEYMVDRQLQ